MHDLVTLLSACDRPERERMVWPFPLVENDLGLKAGEGLGVGARDVAGLEPPAGQDLTEENRKRLDHLGDNPPRDVSGLAMTHRVPDAARAHCPYGSELASPGLIRLGPGPLLRARGWSKTPGAHRRFSRFRGDDLTSHS